MNIPHSWTGGLLGLFLGAVMAHPNHGITVAAPGAQSAETRLQALEDRAEIARLLIDYGRLLDQRDFKAFAQLFATTGKYIGGGATGRAIGPKAIGALLEETFNKNPSGLSGPNFHIFTNATIDVRGDTATATSQGAFVALEAGNHPGIIILATYNDLLIRENGGWKFRERQVQGALTPAIPAATK